MKGSVTLSINLEQADYDKVLRIADREGVSLASVIRDAVKTYRSRRR